MNAPVPRRTFRLAIFAAAVFVFAPPPIAAQVDYFCSALNPAPEVCVGTLCVDEYRRCQFDFDGDPANGFEQQALFFENRGSDSNPPFGPGDRSCYQGQNFTDGPGPPDADDYYALRFALLLPAGYATGDSFPLLIYLRGGGPGWSKKDDPLDNAWALEFPDPLAPGIWTKGFYHGQLIMGQGAFNEKIMRDYLLDTDGLAAGVRDKGWGILVPSGCGHDNWAGRVDLTAGGDLDLTEAANTRFGFDSVAEAL